MADVAASVLARLKNKAAKSGRSYQLCLQLFCQEEFLRRLEKSKYAENLVLKGGLFLYSLTDFDSRVTADVDFLLRKMPNTPEQLQAILEGIIATQTGNDFITFEIKNVAPIAVAKKYAGIGASLAARIKNTKTPFGIDFGVGDIIVPRQEKRKIPTQLDGFEAPTVNTYSLETTVAEKLDGYIDFDFMESFIAELEAERVAELSAYLTVSGLDNYELSSDEENALKNYQSLKWDTYNLEKLFGKSTRGKRLKGDDRIAGTLPFVTAGEASEGISAYISNEVEVFEKNTTTIDMFGSAKYRNYIYGGDDHIAVVHTENLPKYASIFVTTAIHKSSHNGQFDYGHNFYAKDADVLYISLPVNEAGNPDYDKMAIIISAIHKLVIKDVVAYSNRKIKATKAVVK